MWHRRLGSSQCVPAAAGWENPGLHGPLSGMLHRRVEGLMLSPQQASAVQSADLAVAVAIICFFHAAVQYWPETKPFLVFSVFKTKCLMECSPPSRFTNPFSWYFQSQQSVIRRQSGDEQRAKVWTWWFPVKRKVLHYIILFILVVCLNVQRIDDGRVISLASFGPKQSIFTITV